MSTRLRTTLPILVLAAIGLGVSLTIEYVHRQVTGDLSYVSFCTINSRISCDVVLSSPYAQFQGISVSLWAILYYLGILALAATSVALDRAAQRRNLATAIFAAAIFGLIFSAYMATIAFGVLNTLCLLCAALYLVSLALLAAAWRFRAASAPPLGRRGAAVRPSNDRSILLGSGAAAAVLVVAALWEVLFAATEIATADEIRRLRPDFAKWFSERPTANLAGDRGHGYGPVDAPLTIVEFSDFGCGHCAGFDRTLEQVLRAGWQDRVRILYRHFPLDNDCNRAIPTRAHPNACLAAAAADCAAVQGKFWPFHRTLFDNQNKFKRSELIAYADGVGLDRAAFEKCLDDEQTGRRVAQDVDDAIAAKVQSTPTWFLNGKRIEGALDAQRLVDVLTLALADASH